jgi:hypothetical protein
VAEKQITPEEKLANLTKQRLALDKEERLAREALVKPGSVEWWKKRGIDSHIQLLINRIEELELLNLNQQDSILETYEKHQEEIEKERDKQAVIKADLHLLWQETEELFNKVERQKIDGTCLHCGEEECTEECICNRLLTLTEKLKTLSQD